jgi:hypothetical protein
MNRYLSIILLSLATLIAVPSYGVDETHLKQLLETKECEYCDLVGANLENDNLNGYAITYYADGSINQEGMFKNGVKQ